MRAHLALRRDDREILLRPWLFKLTRNCALDEISRVKADTVPLDAPAAAGALVDRDGPDQLHERRANVRGMLEGIAVLPEEQRHALLRREVDGASHADIASELGITGAASRSLVFACQGEPDQAQRGAGRALRRRAGRPPARLSHRPARERPRRTATWPAASTAAPTAASCARCARRCTRCTRAGCCCSARRVQARARRQGHDGRAADQDAGHDRRRRGAVRRGRRKHVRDRRRRAEPGHDPLARAARAG